MLSIIDGRVLGCLMEKERTVPDQYPLTMNALLSACNQSTSRDPVMRLGEHEVLSSLTSMKTEGFVRLVHPSHGRSATRYRHVADEHLGLDPAASALLSVLLLRGPQTLSELRTRTERQHPFGSLDEIDAALHELAGRDLVRLLERHPGQKEARWQQLVADEAAQDVIPERTVSERMAPERTVAERTVAPTDPGLVDRVAELEARVAALEAALADLL